MRNVFGFGLALAAGFLAAVFWVWAGDAERQVRRHQARLFGALEEKKWAVVDRSFSEEYGDRWGHDKEFLKGFSREIFRQFLDLEIRSGETGLEVSGDGQEARLRLRVELRGRGGPYAEGAVAAVRALGEPMVFHWSRRGRSAWDWVLVGFEQPELELPELPVL